MSKAQLPLLTGLISGPAMVLFTISTKTGANEMSDKGVKSDKIVSRRTLLGASAVAGGALLTAPALAQEKTTIEWKMVTSWPKNLPGPGVTAQRIVDQVARMSAGRFRIRLYAAGELVPALGVFDAVSAGTAQSE